VLELGGQVYLPPDVVQGEQGADRAQLVRQVPQAPHHQVAVWAVGGWRVEQVGE
jgi:hypothetical protein